MRERAPLARCASRADPAHTCAWQLHDSSFGHISSHYSSSRPSLGSWFVGWVRARRVRRRWETLSRSPRRTGRTVWTQQLYQTLALASFGARHTLTPQCLTPRWGRLRPVRAHRLQKSLYLLERSTRSMTSGRRRARSRTRDRPVMRIQPPSAPPRFRLPPPSPIERVLDPRIKNALLTPLPATLSRAWVARWRPPPARLPPSPSRHPDPLTEGCKPRRSLGDGECRGTSISPGAGESVQAALTGTLGEKVLVTFEDPLGLGENQTVDLEMGGLVRNDAWPTPSLSTGGLCDPRGIRSTSRCKSH